MSGERKVVCLMGKGDCPENCPAHVANKHLADKVLEMSGIDITTLPPQELLQVTGRYLGVLSHAMLSAGCVKNKVEG